MFERQGTLPIAQALAAELRARHYTVVMTREKDSTLSLEARSKIGNEPGRLCFLSIHLNHADSSTVNGIETYYGWPKRMEVMKELHKAYEVGRDQGIQDQRSQWLAEAVHAGVLAATQAADREVKNSPGLLLLNSIRCPTVLIECGFLSNKAETEKLRSPDYQAKLARGIADGVEKYLNAAAGDKMYGIQIQEKETGSAKK